VANISAPHVLGDETDLGASFRLSFCAEVNLRLPCEKRSVGGDEGERE
jgi:hypothetical protein